MKALRCEMIGVSHGGPNKGNRKNKYRVRGMIRLALIFLLLSCFFDDGMFSKQDPDTGA